MASFLKLVGLIHLLELGALTLLLVAVYHDLYPFQEDLPPLEKTWFGKGLRPKKEDSSIKPFKINIGDKELKDLKSRIETDLLRLKSNHPESLVDSFHYGTHFNFVTATLADHWIKKYDWRKQEKALNAMGSHHITNIDGLDVHFIVAKPDPKTAKGKRILPLLLVHGWPGSFVEFVKVLPLLTSPNPGRDFVLEVIVPSIPGYGFSSAPQSPGFHVGQCARVFNTLMNRLGHKKFYTQGGDWGSLITTSQSIQYPDSVIGAHLNVVFVQSPSSILHELAASIFPSLFLDKQEVDHFIPFRESTLHLFAESGYFHIQTTRPDTVGFALNTSPLGLAAYVIEKFSTFTSSRSNNADAADGNLLNMFNMDELITNVMVYWWSGSITSSIRFYKENFGRWDNRPFMNAVIRKSSTVPVGLALCTNDVLMPPRIALDSKFKNIVAYNHIPKVGHFAFMEAPKLLAEDFIKFVEVVEKEIKLKPKPGKEL